MLMYQPVRVSESESAQTAVWETTVNLAAGDLTFTLTSSSLKSRWRGNLMQWNQSVRGALNERFEVQDYPGQAFYW